MTKSVLEMSEDEYRVARAAAIRSSRPAGITAAELADLAERRGETPASARDMTINEYAAARSKVLRGIT